MTSSSSEMVRRARERVGAGPRPGKRPSLGLVVVTCMDTRIDPARLFRSQPGEMHTVRNAGGLVTDDVLRSLLVSQRYLGTRRVAIVMHTDCGLFGLDDDAEAAAVLRETGAALPFSLGGFGDLTRRVNESVEIVRNSRLLPQREHVQGYIYDVETLRLTEVRPG